MSYRIHFQELEQGIYRIHLKDREIFRIVLPDYPISRAPWPNQTSPIINDSWNDTNNWNDSLDWSD